MTTSPNASQIVMLGAIAALTAISFSLVLLLPLWVMEEFQLPFTFRSSFQLIYFLATAIVQVFAGALSDVLGRRPILLVGLGLYSVGAFGCYWAQDAEIFFDFLCLQSTIAVGTVLMRVAIWDQMAEKSAVAVIAIVTALTFLLPMIGPIVGRSVAEAYGWRANFALLAGLGLFSFAICWWQFGETLQEQSDTTPSKIFHVAKEGSWATLVLSLCSLLLCSTALTSLSVFIPIVVEDELGSDLKIAVSGMWLNSFTLFFGFLLSGVLSYVFNLWRVILVGSFFALVIAVGAWVFGKFVANPVELMFLVIAVIGIGSGLIIAPLHVTAMSALPRFAGTVSGLAGAIFVAGAAVVPFLLDREIFDFDKAGLSLLLIITTSLLAGCALGLRQLNKSQ